MSSHPKNHSNNSTTYTTHTNHKTTKPNDNITEYLQTLFEAHILPHIFRLLDLAQANPLISSFLLVQFLCSCVPIALFIIGAVVAAATALMVFSCVAAFVLGPVVLGTTVLGVVVWGCAWVGGVGGRVAFEALKSYGVFP
ncbi:hypothetical protein BDV25DRAFT_139540 [Aspergillus avenaceus]|uniref:Uncharacterized protein n=1 Tax=Aspergillus avenaceus TaxID=36643 RepID=A0A5N6TXA3_ASPAV|nr:hypothetical protein BDV25DRAFT_139540 [Aspergillus avenaceus]